MRDTPPVIEPSPTGSVDLTDPGADVSRRFRYQYAYGLVLLIRGGISQQRFRAVWFEQHEDLLAERIDGQFDAYQVKTQVPHAGAIECKTESFTKSLRRFAKHEKKFGAKLSRYVFVSNAAEIRTETEPHRSPSKLVAALKAGGKMPAFGIKAMRQLMADTGMSEEELRPVLLKLEVIKAHELDGTNDMLHVMLHKLEHCAGWASYRLEQLREFLLGKALQASSLGGEDPDGYYIALSNPDHPQLQNKRICPEDITATLKDFGSSFRYAPGSAYIRSRSDTVGRVLRQKMERAGLGYYYDSMLRKTVSAEQEFFAMLNDGRKDELNQLECIVKDACDRARLEAEVGTTKFGKPMQLKLLATLDALATRDAAKVHQKSPEFLCGVAGLLAENCHVWWTEPFKLAAMREISL